MVTEGDCGACGAGRVSQGAGAWPAVGTEATLTDLSYERAPRANSNAGKNSFGLLLHITSGVTISSLTNYI